MLTCSVTPETCHARKVSFITQKKVQWTLTAIGSMRCSLAGVRDTPSEPHVTATDHLSVPCTNCVAFSIECRIPVPKRKRTALAKSKEDARLASCSVACVDVSDRDPAVRRTSLNSLRHPLILV